MLPVVFVHGVRSSSRIWDPQVSALSVLGHSVHAVDLPGHGTRDHERFTFSAAQDCIRTAVESFTTPPLLVGLSLGGYSSLAFAAQHSDQIAGLIVAGCSTEIKGKPLGAYRYVSSKFASWFGRSDSWQTVTDMLGDLKGHSSLADLRKVKVPVWMINGSRDPMRLGERSYLGASPGARLHVIAKAGHDVNSEAPTEFNRQLLKILESFQD